MKQNNIIAITGNIGSGKSTVLEIIKEQGFPIISLDNLTDEAYVIAKNDLINTFSNAIISNDSIDRKKLSSIVFNDKEKLNQLNAILHPVLFELMTKESNRFSSMVFIEIPLLFEAGWDKYFDNIWLIKSNKKDMISRVKIRSNLSENDINKRLSNQIDDSLKTGKSTIIIHNDSTLDELRNKVLIALDSLKK